MSTGYLTTGQKLRGFMFHQQELIIGGALLIGLVLFITPFAAALDTIHIPLLGTEAHGFTNIGLVSIVVGAVSTGAAIIAQYFKIER